MPKNICAPNKYDPENNTCFAIDQLVEIAKAYNRHVTKTKLDPVSKQKYDGANLIKIKSDKTYLLSELKKRFDNICHGDEYCMTQQSFMNEIVGEIRDDITNNTFRTKGPDNSKEWLSTVDIDNIMSQYENIYPNFKFFGAVPLNCDELPFCSLYKLDFGNYIKNKFVDLAIIFNLDKYGQPGSHWVALFIELRNGKIYYCDSTGKRPMENIQQIIDQFIEFHKNKTGKSAVYKYNDKSYQQDSSECGIYACNFIIRKLAGEKFEDIINHALNFEEINSCRNIYFRNNTSKFKSHAKCDP